MVGPRTDCWKIFLPRNIWFLLDSFCLLFCHLRPIQWCHTVALMFFQQVLWQLNFRTVTLKIIRKERERENSFFTVHHQLGAINTELLTSISYHHNKQNTIIKPEQLQSYYLGTDKRYCLAENVFLQLQTHEGLIFVIFKIC